MSINNVKSFSANSPAKRTDEKKVSLKENWARNCALISIAAAVVAIAAIGIKGTPIPQSGQRTHKVKLPEIRQIPESEQRIYRTELPQHIADLINKELEHRYRELFGCTNLGDICEYEEEEFNFEEGTLKKVATNVYLFVFGQENFKSNPQGPLKAITLNQQIESGDPAYTKILKDKISQLNISL